MISTESYFLRGPSPANTPSADKATPKWPDAIWIKLAAYGGSWKWQVRTTSGPSHHANREPFLGTHSAVSQCQLPCTHHLSDTQTSCTEGDGLFCRCRSSGTDRKGRPVLGLGLSGMETLKPCFVHMHKCLCSFLLPQHTGRGPQVCHLSQEHQESRSPVAGHCFAHDVGILSTLNAH